MSVVSVVLEACDTNEDALSALTCQRLHQVQQEAGKRVLDLVQCIGKPRKVGDEAYQHREDCEALLGLIKLAEELIRMKQPRAFSSYALPATECNHAYLSAQYSALS